MPFKINALVLLQAKEEFRLLKHRKEMEWAAKIIQRHYIQWKVSKLSYQKY